MRDMQDFFTSQLDEYSCSIMGYRGDEERVVIPAKMAGKEVRILFDGLFKNHPEIKVLKIPRTVTNIGSYLIQGCTKLHSIKLPDGLTEIWEYAFAQSSIEEIVIPDGVEIIMPYTFKDCKKLKKVVCGKGLKKICEGAFEGCDKLKTVEYGPGVEVSPLAYETGIPEYSVHEIAMKTAGYSEAGKKK